MTLAIFAQLSAIDPASYTQFVDLKLSPIIFHIGWFALRWYSLAYLVGIIGGYFILARMLKAPGAPMAQRHADDLIFYATMGVILGGRIGYILFYKPDMILDPVSMLKVWQGGMSFHGGAIGVVIAIWWMTRKHALPFWRVCDYVACVVPFGLLLGRLANFVNGELWGRPTTVAWAIVFPDGGPIPRHPSQLYEAALEGAVLLAVLTYAFWRTHARYRPGLLMGIFTIGYSVARFTIEFFRNPDEQLVWLAERTGLSMGQWLTIPALLFGIWLIVTSARRRIRVEPFAGTESVA